VQIDPAKVGVPVLIGVLLRRQEGGQDDGAEHGAKAPCPPFVQIERWTRVVIALHIDREMAFDAGLGHGGPPLGYDGGACCSLPTRLDG